MVATVARFQATNTLAVPQRLAHLIWHCEESAAGATAYVRAPGMTEERQFKMHRQGTDWQTDDLGLIVLPGEIVHFRFSFAYET
ncbi:hypothetical protein [Deinococcus wulumuqiensis]|uniref:hypothetical protein n=1 Tax=Deinococcus wulumuqiensis TaxID=980427 RepID=UPI00242CC79F|nr:hypothetical protein [Deinococcus wulumuqiensis]